MKDLKEW